MEERTGLFAYDVPEGSSKLAQAALDCLLPGMTTFALADGWNDVAMKALRSHPVGALIALLRSGEDIPPIIRHALADAIEDKPNVPVRLVTAGPIKSVARIETKFRNLSKQRQVLIIYERLRSE